MFADSPGGGTQAHEIAKLEGEREQLVSRLNAVDARSRELDGQEQALEAKASELEWQIRSLAKEESLLMRRKKELMQSAREIGDQRTEILGNRQKFQHERSSLQSAIASLEGRLCQIQQQLADQEAQKIGAIQLEHKTSPPRPSVEQRVHPRVAVEVEVSMNTQHNFYTGLTENLSEGGLFVATYEELPIGTAVALTIRLPGSQPFQAEGLVRWVREHSQFTEDVSPGVGVQFTDLAPAYRTLIEKFIQTRAPLFYETV